MAARIEAMMSFREMCDAGLRSDEYEPQQVCLIPIYLRTRYQFYREAEEAIRDRIEEVWSAAGSAWKSREDFDRSESTNNIWLRESPPWWGANDIVGYLDLRMSLPQQEFQVGLFMPMKRVSRSLRDKKFVFTHMERRPFPSRQPNSTAQELFVEMVTEVCRRPEVKKRYVERESWAHIIRRIDLLGLLQDHARVYGIPFG
jgi:hypothetical protein